MTKEHAFLLGYMGKSASASSFLMGYLEKNAGFGRVVKGAAKKTGRYTPKIKARPKTIKKPTTPSVSLSPVAKGVIGTAAVGAGGYIGTTKAKEYIAKGKEKLNTAGNKSLDDRNKSVKDATGKMKEPVKK